MKMVKSLLLGSAAAVVAVATGQAADLPVKAKPVEYVKICSLYGAGFYYMPGTDMCIKIGGWTRAEFYWGNTNGNATWGPYAGQANSRLTNNMATTARGYITADAREQTAYGTARAYIDVGLNTNDTGSNGASNAFSSNRAFLQWAGITAGLSQSFYDFYNGSAVSFRSGYLPSEDTSSAGWFVWAYTAQLGNGVSATISAEQRRMSQIIGTGAFATAAPIVAAIVNGGTLAGGSLSAGPGYGGMQMPDIVANLRVDQTWGAAQVMGAVHELNAPYYANLVADGSGSGHPSDDFGWVVGAGLKLNFPIVAQGDYFQGEVNYTQGALKYVNNSEQTNYESLMSSTATYGIQSDCVYGSSGTLAPTATTGCDKTTAWGVNASYEHFWTPQFHESFVFAYEQVSYNTQANALLCSVEGTGQSNGLAGSAAVALAGCNNNWSVYGTGSRFQYDVTKSFYLGVEVLYQHLNTATSATGALPTVIGSGQFGAPNPAAGAVGVGNQNDWEATFRMHKDFLP
jgi:hypothetical protein